MIGDPGLRRTSIEVLLLVVRILRSGIDLAGLDVVGAHRRPNNTAGVNATQIRLHQMTSDNLSVPGRYIQAPEQSRQRESLASPRRVSARTDSASSNE